MWCMREMVKRTCSEQAISLLSTMFFARLFFEEKKLSYCDTLGVFCVHKTLTYPHNSKTVTHIQMKIGTLVARNNMHVSTKSNNSGLNNYSVMPLLELEKTDEC